MNHDNTKKELGSRLKQAREKAHLTQAEVAARADTSVNYYAQIERGEVNPSFEVLQKVMKALKLKSLNLY